MNKNLHVAALVLVWAGILFSQSKTSAELSGMVRDPTQAAVPKATITLTNVDTGVKREARQRPASTTQGTRRTGRVGCAAPRPVRVGSAGSLRRPAR